MKTWNDIVLTAVYILNMPEPNMDSITYNKWTFECSETIEELCGIKAKQNLKQ